MIEATANSVGRRVYHEPDNNAPLWRGKITQVDDRGIQVLWDGIDQTRFAAAYDLWWEDAGS